MEDRLTHTNLTETDAHTLLDVLKGIAMATIALGDIAKEDNGELYASLSWSVAHDTTQKLRTFLQEKGIEI